MTYTVSITSQGQFTIPAALRKKLGLGKKTQAIVSEESGSLIIEPVKDLLDLRGSLQTNKKPLSSNELNTLFEEYLAEDVIESMK